MAEKKASNAASPPADAPIPTMGKPFSAWLKVSAAAGVSTDASGGASSDLWIACFMGTVFFFFIRFLLFNAGRILAACAL
jgi:hypothetical protein